MYGSKASARDSNFSVPKGVSRPPTYVAPRPMTAISSVDHVKEGRETMTTHVMIHMSEGLDRKGDFKNCSLDSRNDVWVMCGSTKLSRYESQILFTTRREALNRCNREHMPQTCPPPELRLTM